jgi:ribosomal protein S17E
LALCAFIGLEIYNRNTLHKIVYQFNGDSFVFNLHPIELVYLKTQKLRNVINGYVNELVKKKQIRVNSDNTIEKVKDFDDDSIENFQIKDVFEHKGRSFYPGILNELLNKPVFGNIANSMDALKKYIIKSKKFLQLFYINFGVLSLILMGAMIRVSTGLLRDKPVSQIMSMVIFLIVAIIFYLNRLTKLVCASTIPKLYADEILPRRKKETSWEWRYFLMGSGILVSSFEPLVNYVNKNSSGDGGSSSSSCGSSCGSSCSSCGGCGGGD